MEADKDNGQAVLKLIGGGLVACAHDCSKGGLAVALAEMAAAGDVGFTVDFSSVPNSCSRLDDVMFSESNSRYLIGTSHPDTTRQVLALAGVPYAEIGHTGGSSAKFTKGKKVVVSLSLSKIKEHFYSLEKLMQ